MTIDFTKSAGLVPAIIQDSTTLEVLMLGYMNEAAFTVTKDSGRVTFFSRSKNRLWTKGETSGNFLSVDKMHVDCDNDTLLIMATAAGPVCHTGDRNCFKTASGKNFVFELEKIIDTRRTSPVKGSYVNKLQKRGLKKIAQKVGEEAVETVIAALTETKEDMLNETSDLLFHLLVLLREKGISLDEIGLNLEHRHR